MGPVLLAQQHQIEREGVIWKGLIGQSQCAKCMHKYFFQKYSSTGYTSNQKLARRIKPSEQAGVFVSRGM